MGAIIGGAYAWLKQGGTLVHLLINFDHQYADKLLGHFSNNLNKYKKQIVYIEFDPLMQGVGKKESNFLRANLLNPENLDQALNEAKTILSKYADDSLIYGSALNMLLFSKTYNTKIHKKLLNKIDNGDNCLFTIANNTFEKQISKWEKTAHNLTYSHSNGKNHLGFKIVRMDDVLFKKDEVEIPLSEEEMSSIRLEANKARKHLIPVIKEI